MAKAVSPSNTITRGQAAKFSDLQVAALCKSDLPSDITQQVLEQNGAALAAEFVASVRRHVEARSDTIVRHAKVNRTLTQEQMIGATGREQYVDKNVLAAIPKGEGEEVDVHFFKLGRYIKVGDLTKEYELRGLKPDHYAQAAVNEADPAFADERPNATQWQDANGKFCYLTFGRWSDVRTVFCDRDDYGWRDGWWFAGVPVSGK